MNAMRFEKLALIGCGLIGGSFALALKKAGCVDQVFGVSASHDSCVTAKSMGVIDEIASSSHAAVTGADLVLIAVPVFSIESVLVDIAAHISPNALVMDVGSSKSLVATKAKFALGERIANFVPAHPIAGKELHGVQHAEATLFEHHKTILTPTLECRAELITLAKSTWEITGSKVSVMSPAEHDQALAAISHLPHLIAFAAVNALHSQPQRDLFLDMAGPGFRDFSRIAASSPAVWLDIFLSNKTELMTQLQEFKKALNSFEERLQNDDPQAITHLIEQASQVRKHWRLNG
jgi:prephenate dehydrogenase